MRVPILVPLCSRSRYVYVIRCFVTCTIHAAIRAIAPIDRKWNDVVFVVEVILRNLIALPEKLNSLDTHGFRICRSEINNNSLDVKFLELVNFFAFSDA